MRNEPNVVLLLVLALLLAPTIASAQGAADSYNSGIYGYVSIDYDSGSNTVTGYAETDLDSDLTGWYWPRLSVDVSDDWGNDYSGSCAYDGPWEDYTDATCQFTPSGSQNYTINATHWAWLNYYYTNGCGGLYLCYVDYGNFAQVIDEFGQPVDWVGQDWFAPSLDPSNTYPSPDLILGGTMDSATLAAPYCGDVRDTLISEYVNWQTDKNGRLWRTGFSPQCGDFISWVVWDALWPTLYSAENLALTQTTGWGWMTVLQEYLPYGIDGFFNQLGEQLYIDSGYRNPVVQIQATPVGKRPASDSRHMAGDAADFPTYGAYDSTDWFTWRNAAFVEKASPFPPCVEPYTDQETSPGAGNGYGHLHLDWRTMYGTSGTFHTSSCSGNW